MRSLMLVTLLAASACANEVEPPGPSPYCELAPELELGNGTWWNRTLDPEPSAQLPEILDHRMLPTGRGGITLLHRGTLGPYSNAELELELGYPIAPGEAEVSPSNGVLVDGCRVWGGTVTRTLTVREQSGSEVGPPDWVTDDFAQVTDATIEIALDEEVGESFGESCVRSGDVVLTFELHRSAAGYAALREAGCVQPSEE